MNTKIKIIARILLVFIPPLFFAYFIDFPFPSIYSMNQELKKLCPKSYRGVIFGRCEVSIGELLRESGIANKISFEESKNLPNCDAVEKGWCKEEENSSTTTVKFGERLFR